MKELFRHSGAIFNLRPWEKLDETDLVGFADPVSGELCFCSVIGSMEEIFGVHVYIGTSTFRWFWSVQEQKIDSVGDFLAGQHTVYVQYEPLRELEREDREFARAMGHPLAKGAFAPVFRTIRPGYHPWFVTEGEARILSAGLTALSGALEVIAQNPDTDLWRDEDEFPFVETTEVSGDRLRVDARLIQVHPPEPILQLPELDRKKIAAIQSRNLGRGPTMQVDHFYAPGAIGEKHSRKALIRMALAVAPQAAIAYPPEVGSPEESTGRMLQALMLQGIQSTRKIPSEVHVRKREFKTLLDPLARELGFSVRVKSDLPELEFAKSQLMEVI